MVNATPATSDMTTVSVHDEREIPSLTKLAFWPIQALPSVGMKSIWNKAPIEVLDKSLG
jgi:hypothetical protein